MNANNIKRFQKQLPLNKKLILKKKIRKFCELVFLKFFQLSQF